MSSLTASTTHNPQLKPKTHHASIDAICLPGLYHTYKMGEQTATHALAGLLLGINPLAGAIVGGTSYAASRVVNWGCKKVHLGTSSITGCIARKALTVIAGIGTGIFAAKLAGFSLSFASVIVLKIAAIGVAIAGGIVTFGVIASVIAAAALIAYLLTTCCKHKPDIAQTGKRFLNGIQHQMDHAKNRVTNKIHHFENLTNNPKKQTDRLFQKCHKIKTD